MKLEYEHLALVVRMSLYNPEMRSLLPLLIHRAAFDKDFSGIAASASQLLDQVTQSISNGMHNAVVCTEDVPFYRDEDGLILDSKSTYMGDEFYQGLIDICSVWPEGISDKNIKQPFVSTIPSLILSGEFDPVTPPGYGELLAKTLKNSTHLIGKGQGHSQRCRPWSMARAMARAKDMAKARSKATSAKQIAARRLRKNSGSHIDASLSRQPLVKGERLMRNEVNAVMESQAFRHQLPPSSTPFAMFRVLAQLCEVPSRNIVFSELRGPCLLGGLMAGILAEGAMTLPVTLSGGVLFAS